MYKIKLSPYSKTFYAEWLVNPNDKRHNMLVGQILYGNLDVERLKNALVRYVEEHVLLNSHVLDIDGELYWVQNGYISELEYSNSTTDKFEIIDYVNNKFDLNKGPLYRFRLIQIDNNVYQFILVFHHILVDGASTFEGIFEAISQYYNNPGYVTKHNIETQIKLITNLTDTLINKIEQTKSQCKEFWHKQLINTEGVDLRFLKLNRHYTTSTLEKYNLIEEINFSFYEKELIELNHLKHKYIITPYIYGQVILAMLLHRYTNQKRFAICYPISIKEGTDFIYGGQVNTSVIIYEFDENTTIVNLFNQSREFFKSLKQKGINYSYYPIMEIIQENDKGLLNAFFNQANFRNDSFKFDGVIKSKRIDELNMESIDFLLFEQELEGKQLIYRVRYDKNIIDKELIESFVANYKRLFVQVLSDLLESNIQNKVNAYQMLDYNKYQQIVYEWNKTESLYPKHKTLYQLFEEQVSKTPNNIALIYKDKRFSFEQLHYQVNRLASYLQQKHLVKPNDLILLCLERNEYVPISILAILKAGGAYVPLDITYPDERINHIINDTQSRVMLASEIYKDRLKKFVANFNNPDTKYNEDVYKPRLTVIVIDSKELQFQIPTSFKEDTKIVVTSNDLAYVVYTSGTTGKPKGVMIKQCGVVNLVSAQAKEFVSGCKSIKNYLWYSTYVFDAHVWEFYLPLLTGNSVYLIDDETRLNMKLLSKFVKDSRISIATIPPYVLDLDNILPLEILIVAGDKPNHKILNKYIKHGVKVVNAYGSTENTVCSHFGYYYGNNTATNIGKPISNTTCYILDNILNPTPIGVIGELYVGGVGLAHGYLNQPDLTRERFIDNPFLTEQEKINGKNLKIYKTGDLARWLPDGSIEFIGRKDLRIKIRGYRVELREIEILLMNYPGVRHAAVITKNSIGDLNDTQVMNQYLVGCYEAETKLDEPDILNYLSKYLPKYMKLDALMYFKEIPLGLNGKLDVVSLLDKITAGRSTYLPPSNKLEYEICVIYATVLGIPKENVGINDDFFSLGGNSLLAIKLTTQLQYKFRINTSDVFKLRTPAKLAQFVPQTKNDLRKNMEQIRLLYEKVMYAVIDEGYVNSVSLTKKENKYKIKQLIPVNQLKKINNVLLTGATGHLGCHILYQLLENSQYKIYLLVRAESNEQAHVRVNDKFKYYFDTSLTIYADRIIVLNADIEKLGLGLDTAQYQDLVYNIDSIIHCAALVKHYGRYDELYQANVQATFNLLELAKLTTTKDFHYISTIGVLIDGYVPNKNVCYFTEYDNIGALVRGSNKYVQTKYEAEVLACRYREYGVKSSIYRVGNLCMSSVNYRNQEDFRDNLFYSHCKAMLKFGIVPKEIAYVEISPVDYTALAIVKIFNQESLSNRVYHVFNPHTCNLIKLFTAHNLNVRECTIEEFIDRVLTNLDMNISDEQIELFMLYQLWSNEVENSYFTKVKISQNRTEAILSKLDFKWPVINPEMFSTIIESIIKV